MTLRNDFIIICISFHNCRCNRDHVELYCAPETSSKLKQLIRNPQSPLDCIPRTKTNLTIFGIHQPYEHSTKCRQTWASPSIFLNHKLGHNIILSCKSNQYDAATNHMFLPFPLEMTHRCCNYSWKIIPNYRFKIPNRFNITKAEQIC